MSRQITVKVATSKVIKALETRLATLEKDYASQSEKETKYQKSVDTLPNGTSRILLDVEGKERWTSATAN